MSKDDGLDDLVGIALGIIGGIALAEILKKFMKKRCRYCNNLNEPNQIYCKFCRGRLE